MNGEAVDATNASSKARPHLTFSAAKNYFMVNSAASAEIFFWKLGDTAATTVYTTVID
jgi:hypothetical protein